MGRRTTGSEQGCAYRAISAGKLGLDTAQGSKKSLEWPATQRLTGRRQFIGLKGFQTVSLKDLLGLIGKQYGIAIEGNTQFIARFSGVLGGQYGRCGKARLQGTTHVFGMG